MVEYEATSNNSFAGVGSSSDVVGSAHQGSPSPYQEPDSTQRTLGVYLEYSTTNEGEPIRVDHPIAAYTSSSSVVGKFERDGYSQVASLKFSPRKVSQKLKRIDRQLVRTTSPDLQRKLLAERSKLLARAGPLLKFIKNRVVVYGDYHAVYVSPGYLEFAKFLGISPSQVTASLWVDKARVHLEFDDNSKEALDLAYVSRIFAEKYHPFKAIHKGRQEGKRVLRDLLVITELLEGNLHSPRGERETVHDLFPLRPVVLTAPAEISALIWDSLKSGDSRPFELFKKASAKTLKRFILYLAERENVSGSLLPGFVLNIHPTGDKNPFRPHFHSHALLALAVYDKASGKWYRLKPVWGEPELTKLRELWREELSKVFPGLVPDFKKLNVWAGDRYFSLPYDADSVFFEVKYNARKLFTAFSEYYATHSFVPDEITDLDFVWFIFNYENRTERYGFLRTPRRYLKPVAEAILEKRLEEIDELIERIDLELELDGDRLPETLKKALLERKSELLEERERLVNGGFEYVYNQALEKAEAELSQENITHKRIIRLLDSLYRAKGKRIIGYHFEVLHEDLSLWQFIDLETSEYVNRPPGVLLLGDRGKSMSFFLLDWLWGDIR